VERKLGPVGQPYRILGRKLGPVGHHILACRMERPLVLGVACILACKLGQLGHRILGRIPLVGRGRPSLVGQPWRHMGQRPWEVGWGRLGRKGQPGVEERMGVWIRQTVVVAVLIRIPLLAQPQPLELGWGVLEVLVLVG